MCRIFATMCSLMSDILTCKPEVIGRFDDGGQPLSNCGYVSNQAELATT
jgi:hypothetical protein